MNKQMKKITPLLLILILLSTSACTNKNNNEVEQEISKPKVKVMSISKTNESILFETTGTVKPMKSVIVKSLTSGNVTDIRIEQGSKVASGQTLAYLFDENTETSYATALDSFNTAENSYNSTLISVEETLRQAQLAVDRAQESLNTTQMNHDDTLKNIINTMNDSLDNAIIANQSYLNSINNTLDFIDGTLGVDSDVIYDGLEGVFSAKNASTKNRAENQYRILKPKYEKIILVGVNKQNIKSQLNETISLLNNTKNLIDTALSGLYSTITSANFSQASLSTLIANTISYQNSLATTLAQAQPTYQGITSLEIINKMNSDQAKSSLRLAELNLESAKTSSANAQQNKILTIGGAEGSLQSAKMNFNLSSISKSRQNIQAPFTGVVSKKFVEIGDEVNPGEPLFEISVLNHVKVEVFIPIDHVEFLSLDDEVIINENIKGILSKIDPVADSISKKVKVEIGYDNQELSLIPESFVNIKIPLSKLSDRDDIYIIPLKAVDIDQETARVKLIEDNKIIIRDVEYLQIVNDKMIVKNGLNENDQMIIENGKLLNSGTEVEIESY